MESGSVFEQVTSPTASEQSKFELRGSTVFYRETRGPMPGTRVQGVVPSAQPAPARSPGALEGCRATPVPGHPSRSPGHHMHQGHTFHVGERHLAVLLAAAFFLIIT